MATTCKPDKVWNMVLDQAGRYTYLIEYKHKKTGVPLPFNGAALIFQVRENATDAAALIDARDTTITGSRIEVIDDALGTARLIIEGASTKDINLRAHLEQDFLMVPTGQTSGKFLFGGSFKLKTTQSRI